VQLVLRPHPSDPDGKYDDWVRNRKDIDIVVDTSSSLADAISKSNWVMGCESYALVIALAAGRKVYSALPPWAPACRLPHKGIIQVKNF